MRQVCSVASLDLDRIVTLAAPLNLKLLLLNFATSSPIPNKHGDPLCRPASSHRFVADFGRFNGTFCRWFGCTVAGGVPGSCRRCAGSVSAGPEGPAAAGRRHRPAGLCSGARGYRPQSSDAVSRLVPQQTRICCDICRFFGWDTFIFQHIRTLSSVVSLTGSWKLSGGSDVYFSDLISFQTPNLTKTCWGRRG